MSRILQELADPALTTAVETNFAEEMLAFGHGLPEGEIHEEPDMLWFYTGRPYLNSVMLTTFPNNDAAFIDARIESVLDYCRARQSTLGWSVGPSTRPLNLAMHLKRHDFVYALDTVGMAIELDGMQANLYTNNDLIIQEALDAETLQPLYNLEIKGFGATAEIAQAYFDTYINIGFGSDAPWHHYLGYLDGTAVAMGSLLLHAGVAGVYGITTLPEFRKQGIGASMTLHVMREARKYGYKIAMLSPTEMSENMYRRIGFRECCRIAHYGWSPIQ